MKSSWNMRKLKNVCVVLYFGLLCTLTGFPGTAADIFGQKVKEKPARDYKEAVQYVSASMVAEPMKIALTFDDGPSGPWTPELLDGLKEKGVRATFFLIGKNAEKYPDIVRRIDEEGHLIGNHTYNHIEITKVTDEEVCREIMETNNVITSITGKDVEFMRPPFGLWQRDLELKLDVVPVLWTVDPLDWTTENVEQIVNKVVTATEENDIILMHDCYKSSVEATLQMIDALEKKGFEFVTVDELIMN